MVDVALLAGPSTPPTLAVLAWQWLQDADPARNAIGAAAAWLQAVAASLGHTRWAFVWRIKWPLLRAALAASFAVGFAVSVAQYLPTLYVGAGRFGTATTEAVALAAGGQRSLMAAFAALQWLLPALVFGLAAWAGRERRFAPPDRGRARAATPGEELSHTLH